MKVKELRKMLKQILKERGNVEVIILNEHWKWDSTTVQGVDAETWETTNGDRVYAVIW
jgi:hypothetical protein